MTRYSSASQPIKVVVKAAVLQVFQSNLCTSAEIKRWAWRNLAVRRTTTLLLWIMTSIAQQPLESPGTHSADVQTLISDPTTFP